MEAIDSLWRPLKGKAERKRRRRLAIIIIMIKVVIIIIITIIIIIDRKCEDGVCNPVSMSKSLNGDW